MLRAVVTTHSSGAVEVAVEGVIAADGEEGAEGLCERTDLNGEIQTDAANCPELNPIAPEVKEIVWGFGAFVVLAVMMRYVLFPKVREGMRQRYDSIQADKASAETLTSAAQADVQAYEAQLVGVRAEAQARVDAARQTLEGERNERIAEVNGRIAEQRAAMTAEVDAARASAMGDVEGAVGDVVGRAAELATGAQPSSAVVQSAVRNAMGSGVAS